ncbi:hypothetical protein LPMP_090790 [Leishmania panamensis]|uniref:Transmembrane protein n=1 Tax=Leishmania panamensis TaxID=5679 RepID=A0A088RJK7_LEIPA|nr:hypothetical protein LPMP_090790 [Leishmania panamensis]AIN95995.1 hypothetical protein LPMP_090790 [Leishmania panamensis]
MPSRRRVHKRGDPQAPQAESEQQQRLSNAEDAASLEPRATPVVAQQPSPLSGGGGGGTDDNSYISVWADEEDSYRLITERDEHLARIRAYRGFYDQLGCIKRAEARNVSDDGDVQPRWVADILGINMAPASPAVPRTTRALPTPLQQQQNAALGNHSSSTFPIRTPTDLGDAVPGSEIPLRASFMSMVCDGPQPLGESDHETSSILSPTVAETNQLSRLQAENSRMAVELQASQEAVQQLYESLREARETLRRYGGIKDKDDAASEAASDRQQHPFPPAIGAWNAVALHRDSSPVTVGATQEAASSRPSLHPPLASPTTASLLSNSASSVSGSIPSSPIEPPPGRSPAPASATCTEAAPSSTSSDHLQAQSEKVRQYAGLQGPLALSPSPKRLPPSPLNCLDGNGARGHFPRSSSKLFDVAEFFWALQVAPPPPTLRAGCDYSNYCQASTTPLRSPPSLTGMATQLSGVYGATGRAVEKLPSTASAEQEKHVETEEAAALACECAWVNSNYYCYNIMDEMSSLRVVPSPDEIGHGISPAASAVNEDELMRRLLNHTPTATSLSSLPLPEYNTPRSSLTPHRTSAAMAQWLVFERMVAPVWSPSSPENAALFASILPSPTTRCYRLPYLQRLWVTSVLRHLLLFLLVTLICILLFIPGIVLGTVNVFEAAEGEDFYALHNRFGHSALLVVARLGACTLVLLTFFSAVCVIGGWQQQQQQQQDAEKAAAVAVAENECAPPATTAAKQPWLSIFSVKSVGALVHLTLCVGTGLTFFGAVLFRKGYRNTNLRLVLLGQSCYGAGEALLLGGLGTIVSAEVGVAAGVSVSMQILLLGWLIVNAFGSFIVPKLSYYIYIAAALLDALVYVTGFIGALVFGVVMLCPRDQIERAVHASAKDVTLRRLWSAVRHDVSLYFFLRSLTVGLLTAAMVLLMSSGLAIFVPTQAAAAAVAASTKSSEQMATNVDKGTGGAAEARFLTSDQDSWAMHQRHAPVLLFTYALVTMPMCFIPRLASLINRWCPVALLTTLLCAMWMISTGASWAPILGLDVSASNSGGKSDGVTTKVQAVSPSGSGIGFWLAKYRFLNPCISVCGIATGVIYTIVLSSLLRSITNAGVQLPVMHRTPSNTVFHKRDRKAAAAAARFPSEATPLLANGERNGKHKNTDAAAVEVKCPDAVSTKVPTTATALPLGESKTSEELQRRVRMQLRGGPAVMIVLVWMLIMMVLLLCVTVMMVAAVLLTDRAESPLYVSRLLPGVTMDEHLVLKSTLACVLIAAMLVQWVEMCHRFCRSCS